MSAMSNRKPHVVLSNLRCVLLPFVVFGVPLSHSPLGHQQVRLPPHSQQAAPWWQQPRDHLSFASFGGCRRYFLVWGYLSFWAQLIIVEGASSVGRYQQSRAAPRFLRRLLLLS